MNVEKLRFSNFLPGKTKLLLLLFILAIPVTIAEIECSKVFVVKFNYDNGLITYKDKVIKCGYAPDRKLQPEEGYTAEIISIDNKPLHSFKFEIPLELNFDLSDPIVKTISGGMVILNTTDFALIFPYYDKAKSIIIYNPRDYEIVTIPLIEEQFIQKRSFLWLFILIILILTASYIICKYYKPKQRKTYKQN